MNSILEEIVEEFHRAGVPKIIPRELDVPHDVDKAVTIIGLRRVGKTYFLYEAIRGLLNGGIPLKEIIYINFEDERLSDFSVKDFSKIVELFYTRNPQAKKAYFFFDEIQNISGWEKFVRRILDKKDFRVYITGSSSKLLSKEIATTLRGRSLSFHLFPLSFREFLRAKGFPAKEILTEEDRGTIKGLMGEYIKFGGFPEIANFDENLKIRTLKEYLDLIIYKDLVERHGIKKLGAMRFLIKSVARNFANEISISKLRNFLKSAGYALSKNKAYEYFSYLEDVGFVHTLRKFSRGVRDTEGSIPKMYLIDTGFATLYGAEDAGRRMENIAAIELFRRKHYFSPLLELGYWKGTQDIEVDFVISEGGKVKQLVQACYNLDDINTKEREFKALLKASEELKCKDLLVITWDREGQENFRGIDIKLVPLWKWLLEPSAKIKN